MNPLDINLDQELEPCPSATATDYFAGIVKLGISALPDWGGPAAELFGMIAAPLIGQRRDDWFEQLRLRFNVLCARVEGVGIPALAQNEQFISVLLAATQAAVRTHQQEKREALRNAVLNVALGNETETDRQTVFVGLIDRFTVVHLSILRVFADPESYCRKHQIPVPKLEYGLKKLAPQLVFELMPDIGRIVKSPVEDRSATTFQMTEWVLSDLEAANLISLDRHQQTWSVPRFSSSPYPVEVGPLITHLGEDFLAFITEPTGDQS